MIPFSPARDWLVVEMEGVRDKTSSGVLYIPDTAKEAPQIGKVLAVGPGKPDDPPMVSKVGDRILFAKYAGSEIDWSDGKTYLFVRESDVVSYVKED